MQKLNASEAKKLILDGGLIAYPTEAVYGLGCDPDNLSSLERLLKLKQRPWQKGLILVAANIEQLFDYIDISHLSKDELAFAQSKWPGPFTFVMPAQSYISSKLKGNFDSIAVRVSAHPVVKEICLTIGKPLVSTSANLTGKVPAMTENEIECQFTDLLDGFIEGDLGKQTQPSTIIDAKTGNILRQG